MVPEYETLSIELFANVANIQLNRPDKANAMNLQMWDDLRNSFAWADNEPSVRVVVLSGNGKHFCAGMDLSVFGGLAAGFSGDAGRNSEKMRLMIKKLQNDLSAIELCRKPVLAAVQGAAVGGAIDMLTCCDMRYCTEDTKFAIKEIDIGMTADVGTLQRLPKLIGDGVARELAYTGRNFYSPEALALGFVNRVFTDKETMLQGVLQIASQIASKSPLAIRGTKEMILFTRDHSVADGLNYIATWNAAMLMSPDMQKTLEATLEGKVAEYGD
jgi:enoyl-CoA hydratase